MKLRIPFYSNTSDNTHCFQASLKMILKYFLPGHIFSWEKLEKMSAKKEGLWTWPTATILVLKKMGFDLVVMEDFDYERFGNEGEYYLLEKYGRQAGRAQIEHSDILQEIKLAKQLIKALKPINRVPSFDDIRYLMQQGYLIGCNINSRILNNKAGYVGHFLVITGIGNNKIIVHDPGLPPHQNRVIPKNIFEKAWGYPSHHNKNLIGFKLSKKAKKRFALISSGKD